MNNTGLLITCPLHGAMILKEKVFCILTLTYKFKFVENYTLQLFRSKTFCPLETDPVQSYAKSIKPIKRRK